MILGGSNCQKNAFFKAERMGFETVLIEYNADPPAKEYADFHERVSTFDVPACITAAHQYGVDAVMTIGTDQPVYTAAAVAEQMNLPSPIDVRTAYRVTNKKAMKERFTQYGIPTVPYRFVGMDDIRNVLKEDNGRVSCRLKTA
jgi:phosphoribosylaminoimidazole carboxylase (NCAIR synthetase)